MIWQLIIHAVISYSYVYKIPRRQFHVYLFALFVGMVIASWNVGSMHDTIALLNLTSVNIGFNLISAFQFLDSA